MRASTLLLTLLPALAVARPNTLVTRQEEGETIDVPEGPLPECSAYCFGRWGWPITLCTGQEGLNHLIECFYDECVDEQSRIHAQLAAEQNCEEGMGWPDRTDEDVEYAMPPAPAAPSEEESEASTSATPTQSGSGSSSASGSESASPTASGPNTGGFDVENPGASGASESPSATESPNGARQTAYVGYAGVAAAAMAFAAL